jgi:hypothetical protein
MYIEAMMHPQLVFGISVLLGLVVWGMIGARYIWPALRARPRNEALRPLLLLHAFRFVGLAFLVPGVVSPDLPDAFVRPAAYGDLATSLLALLAIALHILCGFSEAAIASIHARAPRAEDTDWKTIVSLYATLMTIRPSPTVALNRAIAIAQSEGPDRGLEALSAITDSDRLTAYPFYSAALDELECRRGRYEVAGKHFREALALARNPMERRFLDERVSDSEKACR